MKRPPATQREIKRVRELKQHAHVIVSGGGLRQIETNANAINGRRSEKIKTISRAPGAVASLGKVEDAPGPPRLASPRLADRINNARHGFTAGPLNPTT
jgi:hypothetical protein